MSNQEADEYPGLNYPEPGDELVDGRGQKLLFADWMSGDWYAYADAYKDAADMLVDQIKENWSPHDPLILPIIFLYRHFVELKLKWIVFQLDLIGGTHPPSGLKGQHDLRSLWAYVKYHLTCLRSHSESQTIEGLEMLIRELSDLDPKSIRFRYSHDRKDQAFALPHQISMQHFKEGMGKLADGLLYIEAGIDIEREGWEIDAELQAEANEFMDHWA
jgi:hypothetical protein